MAYFTYFPPPNLNSNNFRSDARNLFATLANADNHLQREARQMLKIADKGKGGVNTNTYPKSKECPLNVFGRKIFSD